MVSKDPEKAREYLRQWRKNNPEKCKEYIKRFSRYSKEANKKYRIKNAERLKAKNKKYRIKNAERLKAKRRERQKGMKHHDSYHDFETHRELAMNSGIENKREWTECSKRGLLPDGIYSHPEKVFGRK